MKETKEKVSIAVRPGTIDDIPQAHAINIHYVLNTVTTFQQTPSLLAEFEAKFRSITARGLPFLVAVERPASSSSDVIIGYAHLTPFRGTKLSYAPSVELSIYLHHSHTGKGTGSLLLATLLATASSPEGGGIIHYPIENSNYSTSGHQERSADEPYGYPIRNIIACMALDPEGKDTGEWLCQWYAKQGFVERGRLKQVGFKKDKWIDTVYMQYTIPDRKTI